MIAERRRLAFSPTALAGAPEDIFVPRRVLLVDDHPDGRDTLRMVLELWGHWVEMAGDGRKGVLKALAWRPEVAVIDIGLPFLDGFQVARKLRAALPGNVLLIALTGYGRPCDRDQALDAGFDVFMTKPADFDALASLIGRRSAAVVA